MSGLTPDSATRPASPAAGLPPIIPDHESVSLIGRGAYGEVWLARNLTTGLRRAVKIVRRSEFEDDRPCQREFEGLLRYEPVSRSHPGLVQVLHVGRNEAEGYFYYVMELADAAAEIRGQRSVVSGQKPTEGLLTSDLCLLSSQAYRPCTLRHELKSHGRLPIADCLALGRSLAAALGHLHRHGLVHRDIKPSNIIFVDGQPKLADIGLVTAADSTLSCVGTEGYIPPEGPGGPQGDLYSLGKTLYEMGTGLDRRQFPELPADLGQWPERKLLLELNEMIVKACAADSKQRYRRAEEMEHDLARLQEGRSLHWRRTLESAGRLVRRAAPVAVTAAIAIVLVNLYLRSSWPDLAPVDKASVFVLPFRNEGTNGIPDDLRGRITDAFIDSLAVIEGVRHSPRKSAWIFQDEDELRHSLAKTNDMRHILAGRVGGEGEVLTIELKLYRRGQDRPVWSGSFTEATNEVITLERRGLAALATALRLKVTEAEQQRIDQLLTNNLEALAWCRKGWEAQRSFSVSRLAAAKEAFHRATELDPYYVDAHAGVLWIYRCSADDRSHREIWPDLTSRARSILLLEDTQLDARHFLGWARIFHYYDWADGSPGLTAALEDERNPGVWAHYYRVLGRMEEARRFQAEQDALGLETGPLAWHVVIAKYFERRYSDVVAGGRKVQRNDPEHNIGYWLEAWGHIGLRDYPAAIDAIQRGRALYERQDLHALQGYVYARMGERDEAMTVLRELGQLQYTQPYWVARIHAALGNTDQALTWLEKAYEDRSEYLVHVDLSMGGLRLDEVWDGLRSEPRFQELLRKTGLDVWPK